jgi:hypothetical protein
MPEAGGPSFPSFDTRCAVGEEGRSPICAVVVVDAAGGGGPCYMTATGSIADFSVSVVSTLSATVQA